MIEKTDRSEYGHCGLKIAAGKEKSPKPLEALRILDLVPVTGLEPVRCRQRRILRASTHLVSNGIEWNLVEFST